MLPVFENPPRALWPELIRRFESKAEDVGQTVAEIVQDVQRRGDDALKELTLRFDGVEIDTLALSAQEIRTAAEQISPDLTKAINQAASNIRRFHQGQVVEEKEVQTMPGVTCWRKAVAIEKVGLYIPGGSAPLFSTVLMLAIPAQIAGCKQISICTPPRSDGSIHPAICFAAEVAGVDAIYRVGGAQAIAALAYGTDTISAVDKIFGPGNRYVTEAKQQVQRRQVSIDMPAGPSEVLVLMDETTDPSFAAADLLAQAEHGPDSQVIVVSTQLASLRKTQEQMASQLESLPRGEIAKAALQHSRALFFDQLEEALAFTNTYAPEHLIILRDDCEQLANQITNAGSVFLGHYTPESVGDYASGTNHTLPTGGWARSCSGVSVDSFVRKITFQQLTQEGLSNISSVVEIMAQHEELEAHRRTVTIRKRRP